MDMPHALIIEPFRRVAGDEAGPVVGQQPRLMGACRLIAA